MAWIAVIIIACITAITGFLVGVAYGQEHPHE